MADLLTPEELYADAIGFVKLANAMAMAQRSLLHTRQFGVWNSYHHGIAAAMTFGFRLHVRHHHCRDTMRMALEVHPPGFRLRPRTPVLGTVVPYGSFLALACSWLPGRVLWPSSFHVDSELLDELRVPPESITAKRMNDTRDKIVSYFTATKPEFRPVVCAHFSLVDPDLDLNDLDLSLAHERGMVMDRIQRRVANQVNTATARDHPDNWKPLGFFSKEGNKRDLVREAGKPGRKSKRVERKLGVDGKTYLYCVSDARQWGYYP